MEALLQAFLLPSLLLAIVNSVWWVPVSPSSWELKALFPRFTCTSHGNSLHPEAGCQWWKLLDTCISGTQPLFSDTIFFNLYNYLFFRGIKERQRYTIDEDCALIKFVNENEYYYPVKGRKLYKRAEKAKVCHELLNCSAPSCNNFGRHAEWKNIWRL